MKMRLAGFFIFFFLVSVCCFYSESSMATEWLEGSDYDDTIVYGSIFHIGIFCKPCIPPCYCGTYEMTVEDGNGICLFIRDDEGTYYRGSSYDVDFWENNENPYSIKGDDTSAGNGDDVIYPADWFGEDYIVCSGAYRIDMGNFPSTRKMQIYGDWSYDSATYGGDDLVYGWNNRDSLYGGHGNDYVFGEDDNDYIQGGYGNDYLYQNTCLSESQDTPMIQGGAGIDRLYGSSCNDWLYGDGENDYLFGYAGDDHMLGGDGSDDTCGSTWPNPESGYNYCSYCENCNDCDDCSDCSC